ncbi:MAG: tetratricopeptide repeat protein [Bacteroides sp.]|nr:tetratricopeptide repeat protein [Bacteroides sp.]
MRIFTNVKHVILIIILISSSAITAAQSSDSIKSLKQAKNLLNNNLYSYEDYQNTLKALDIIGQSAETDSISFYGATALSKYAWMLINLGEQDTALPLFRKALEYCPPEDSVIYYDIITGMGGIYLNQGNYEEAQKIITAALKYHTNTSDSLGMIKDYFNIAALYFRKDKPSSALSYAYKALTLAEKSHNYDYQSHILGFLSQIETDSEHKDSLLAQASLINYRNDFTGLTAHNLHLRAKLYLSLHQFDKAMNYAEKSMDVAKKYNQTSIYIAALRTKAKIYAELKDYPQAYFNLNLANENESANQIKEKSLRAQRGEYATRLIDWCEANLVKRNGHYVMRKPMSTSTKILIILGILVVLTAIVIITVRIKRGKEEINDIEKTRLNSEISQLMKDKEEMWERINYFMFFHNNHNVLMDKIRSLAKQGLSTKESEQASSLRKIGAYAASNMLDKLDDQYTALQKENEDAFLLRLQKSFPSVTDAEKKLATYLRAGLSTHEICVITGNQPRSINMTRYRLRKSLQLGEGENLEQYLRSI